MRYSLRRIALILSLVAAVFAPAAAAQEKAVRLVAAFPLDVGLFWQASDRIALRLDTSIASGSFQASSPTIAPGWSKTATGYGLGAMVGGQYWLHDRVAVFAESGVDYTRSAFPNSSVSLSNGGVSERDDSTNRITSVGTGGNVGLVFFF